MARFQRSNNRPIQRSNRVFEWIGGVQTAFAGGTALAAGASTIISGLDTRNTAIIAPWTIMRLRGYLYISTDQAAAFEEPHGAYGLCVVNGEAFDAGVASIPTPFTESFDDRWFFHTYWALSSSIRGTDGYQTDPFKLHVDGKAMRKVNFGDVIVSVIENGSTSDGCLFTENSRMGVKLH